MDASPVFCTIVCLSSVLLSSGCATRPAPDFGGKWQPINGYEASARALPLQRVRQFRALPTDRTLRTLLGRWARESNRTLRYRNAQDFSLHTAVASIDSGQIEAAAAQLAEAYAGHDLAIEVSAHEIVVGHAVRAGHLSEVPVSQLRPAVATAPLPSQ